ncbi:chemotaxis protein CheW [Massilia sp. YIM B02763]|uniref:chemotaxis protein CheW n=1 Tax=Massilia sp. YIM B02763 TaxID=3050130 RepID=UPI0025B71ED1|nr:chemotaxis protein CheW [Massilia sp. YIM B02763]MDN4055534.1 chemotaxis protein CheW [Massilia sp. YIM B02763]
MHAHHVDGADGPLGLRLAEATVGAVRLGIPADAVLQAIPAPRQTTLLPRRHGALSGIVDHDGVLVPVVDLGRWVDVGSAPAATGKPHILVLRASGGLLGLRVDTVGAVLDAAPGAATRLYHDDDPEEVFHSAVRSPADGGILSLLDVDRLAVLAAAWSDAAGLAAGAPDPASAAPAGAGLPQLLPYALLRAGGARLGVPAADLVEVIPMPPLEQIGGIGGIGGAYCMWRGRHVAVLAGADVLPTSAASDASAPLLAVIEHGGLALGVPVHAVLQLAGFDPSLAVSVAGCVAEAFDADGPVHLLDTARLFARSPEAALSRPADAAPAARQGGGGGQEAHNAVAYIVFEADGMQAVPIDAVEQVTALAAPAPATLEWQDRAIPVADLRGADGYDTDAGAHLMVVRAGERHLACVVTRVHVLIPPGDGRLYRMGGQGGLPLEFITTGSGAEQASYRTVDLAAQAVARLAA